MDYDYDYGSSSRKVYDGRKCRCCFKLSIGLAIIEIIYLFAAGVVISKELFTNTLESAFNVSNVTDGIYLDDGYIIVRNDTWQELIYNVTHEEATLLESDDNSADKNTIDELSFESPFVDEPYREEQEEEQEEELDENTFDDELENDSLETKPKLLSISIEDIKTLANVTNSINTSQIENFIYDKLKLNKKSKYYIIRGEFVYLILATMVSTSIFLITIFTSIIYCCRNYVC